MRTTPTMLALAITLATSICAIPVAVAAPSYSAWGTAIAAPGINTPAGEGCPIEAPSGLELYIASNRGGTLGGNDIWVATRLDLDAPWGTPRNLGAPVNSLANDFCPTPLPGKWLMFVSERPGAETCHSQPGRGDMYLVRENPNHGWEEPLHLGCAEAAAGPNTGGSEFSPSLVETDHGTFLFFSTDGYTGNMDLFVSALGADGSFLPAARIDELSTGFDDRMPNVSKNGLEIVFSSNRPGGFGAQDVYVSVRDDVGQPWSAPVNVGVAVNTAGSETRASLSSDGKRLYFGRDGDVFVSNRAKITGAQ